MQGNRVQEIRAQLAAASRILAISHISPDGDAIGSLTAVGVALRQMDKTVTLVCDDSAPSRFNYLPQYHRIQQHVNGDAAYDLVIALDCGDTSRMGNAFAQFGETPPPLINIDHHVTNTYFGDVNLVRPECVSATEILYHLFLGLDLSLTTDLATCLLTGIVTDTLGFRTVGVTASTFETASALMEAGADLSTITTHALLIKPLSAMRLWQIGLDNMKLEQEGILWTSISDEERAAIGYNGTSSSGLVNMMANVDEVAMSAVLMEAGDRVYVSFRCRPPYSVAELARNLGGGGHPLAAGCTLDSSLERAESLVLGMSREAIRQQRSALPQ